MNLKSQGGAYTSFSKRAPLLNNTDRSLLERTLHDESFEKLERTILNPNQTEGNIEGEGKQDIPLIEKITLGPIEKYQMWNRYPWKMLIHILLIVMTTLQVLVTIQADTSYSRTQSRVMDRVFLTPEGETDDLSDRRERYLFNIEELQNFIKSSVENYYSLNDRLLENYSYFLNEENKIQEVEVDVVMTEGKTYSLKHNYFHLNETHLGPFGLPNKELKTFLKDVEKIVLGYSFQNELPEKAAPNFN